MRKRLLSMISVTLITLLTCGLINPALAAQPNLDNASVKAKMNLVAYANQQEGKKSKQLRSQYDIEGALGKLRDMVSNGNSINDIATEMNKSGIYILGQTPETRLVSETPVVPMTSTSDVNMSAPIVSYITAKDEWAVTGGGWWANTNWRSDVPPTRLSNSIDLGGTDGYGVSFTSTSGEYKSKVIRSYCEITDGNGTKVSTPNRSDGNGQLGFGFRLQDCVNNTLLNDMSYWKYVGSHFSAQCIYDNSFASYHGVATTYYIHTWNVAQITGISFGISGTTAGLSISVSDSQHSFISYSVDSRY